MNTEKIPQNIQELADKWADENWGQNTPWWVAKEGYEAGACKEREQTKKWKEVAQELYQALWIAEPRDLEGEPEAIIQARIRYSQYINELP